MSKEEPNKVDLLLAEYNTLRTEMIMYINKYWQIIGGSGAIIIAGLAASEKVQIVYVLLPLIVFITGYIMLTLGFLMMGISGRIKEIERTLSTAYKDDTVMRWERKWSKDVIWPLMVRCHKKGQENHWISLPNPPMTTIGVFILVVAIFVIASLFKAWNILSYPYNYGYMILVACLLVYGVFAGYKFIQVQKIIDDPEAEFKGWKDKTIKD